MESATARLPDPLAMDMVSATEDRGGGRHFFNQPVTELDMWRMIAFDTFSRVEDEESFQEINVPTPGTKKKPELLTNYERSSWRNTDMTFMNYLRKSDKDGRVARHIRSAYKTAVVKTVYDRAPEGTFKMFKRRMLEAYTENSPTYDADSFAQYVEMRHGVPAKTLMQFANEYVPRGEKIIADMMAPMLNDEYYGQWVVLHVPFTKIEELQQRCADEILAVPCRYKYFTMAMTLRPDFWLSASKIIEQMMNEECSDAFIETIVDKVSAQVILVSKYIQGSLNKSNEFDNTFESEEEVDANTILHLTSSQKHFRTKVINAVEAALRISGTKDEEEQEALVGRQEQEGKMLVALGQPGTGKTAVIHQLIKEYKKRNARILFALPTRELTSNIRAIHPQIDVETCYDAFLLQKSLSEALPLLTQYDMVIIDEISMIPSYHLERITDMWEAASRVPCLVLMGDFCEVATPIRASPLYDNGHAFWSSARITNFSQQVRCKDRALLRKLQALRTPIHSVDIIETISRNRRAWTTSTPTEEDILNVYERTHGQSTFLTCTKRGATLVNNIAIKVLFLDRLQTPLAVIPSDYDDNLENYTECGKLTSRKKLYPLAMTIYKGLRIFLTRDLDKQNDFVNGMRAVVEDYTFGCLIVKTQTGKRLAVYEYTEDVEHHGQVKFFPIRVGYACTAYKVLGQTLPHVTVWLDALACRGVAYVALSRVQYDSGYLIGGQLTPQMFAPAM